MSKGYWKTGALLECISILIILCQFFLWNSMTYKSIYNVIHYFRRKIKTFFLKSNYEWFYFSLFYPCMQVKHTLCIYLCLFYITFSLIISRFSLSFHFDSFYQVCVLYLWVFQMSVSSHFVAFISLMISPPLLPAIGHVFLQIMLYLTAIFCNW